MNKNLITIISAGVLLCSPFFFNSSVFGADTNDTQQVSVQQSPADRDQTQAVRDAIAKDRNLSDQQIDVRVNGGVATLNGNVTSSKQKTDAESLVKNVKGIDSVVNNLQIANGPMMANDNNDNPNNPNARDNPNNNNPRFATTNEDQRAGNPNDNQRFDNRGNNPQFNRGDNPRFNGQPRDRFARDNRNFNRDGFRSDFNRQDFGSGCPCCSN